MRTALWSWAIIWSLASAAALAADDPVLAQAQATPPGVHQVRTGGFWAQGDDEGFYRVVVIAGGYEHVAHRIYVQWLSADPDRGYRLVRTSGIRELNELNAALFDVAPLPRVDGPLRISVTVTSRDGASRKRTVTVTADGHYVLQ